MLSPGERGVKSGEISEIGIHTPPAEALGEPLTRREREILALLAQGYSGPESAEQLTLTINSVKGHVQHLYAKLGVHGRRQARARARFCAA